MVSFFYHNRCFSSKIDKSYHAGLLVDLSFWQLSIPLYNRINCLVILKLLCSFFYEKYVSENLSQIIYWVRSRLFRSRSLKASENKYNPLYYYYHILQDLQQWKLPVVSKIALSSSSILTPVFFWQVLMDQPPFIFPKSMFVLFICCLLWSKKNLYCVTDVFCTLTDIAAMVGKGKTK